MSQHIVQVTTSDMSRLRDWMSHPNGSLNLGRATLEAVVGGGILIRTRPYREGEPLGYASTTCTPKQQPAPDVSALVEALEACRDELSWMIEHHNQQDHTDGSWLYDYQTVVEADAALAAHRKQGDSKP